MITLDELRRARRAQMDRKQDVLQSWPALLGRVSDETVDIASRPGYVYIRIGSDETHGQARNKKVRSVYDLAVFVGYDGISSEFQVLASRQEDWIAAGNDPIPEVGAHGETHTWPTRGDSDSDGSDVVYVDWRQILGLRIRATTGFTVEVDRAPLYRTATGQWEWIATQQLDLSGDQPVAGACWILVYLDESGVLQKRVGSTLVPSNSLAFTDCPAPGSDEFPLAAVRLYSTQTAITETRTDQDVVDLRFQASGGGGAVPDHNDLGSIQGGQADQYYHTTQAQHTAVVAMVTAGLDALTQAEVDQLENIAATTISAAQWGYLGVMDQSVATGASPTFAAMTIASAGSILPTDASGQNLGDATHRWDLYTQDVIFGGGVGANVITIPDASQSALEVVDGTTGDEYIGIRTLAQKMVVVNRDGVDIDFVVEAVGHADALFVQGSDGQITLGALGAGHLSTDLTGVIATSVNLTMANLAWIGIAGPAEHIAFDAAESIIFGGVTSVVVPDGCWVGADANCAWAYNLTSSFVTTLDTVGIKNTAPGPILDSGAVASFQVGDGSASIYASIKGGTNNEAMLAVENDARSYRFGILGNDTWALYDDTADALRIVVDTAGNMEVIGRLRLTNTVSFDTRVHALFGGPFFQNAAANNPTSLRVLPNGAPVGWRSAFEIYNTDFLADNTNWERVRMVFSNVANVFEIISEKGGTGTVRPMALMGAAVKIGNLAGVGVRAVVAAADGTLSAP